MGPSGSDAMPRLRFMRTEGNLWLFDQLETLVCDPDDPEDVLKVNADPDTGLGGDDGYDSLRYGIASRPMPAGPNPDAGPVRAWDPAVLKVESEKQRRHTSRRRRRDSVDEIVRLDPDLGQHFI